MNKAEEAFNAYMERKHPLLNHNDTLLYQYKEVFLAGWNACGKAAYTAVEEYFKGSL